MRAYRLFSEEQAAEIVAAIRDREWVPGKASRQTNKRNLELKAAPELAEITKALKAHPLYTENLVSQLYPPKFNWYRDSGEYKIHSDAALMGDVRTDMACTIFLTDDYDGGELNIDGKAIKGRAGMCVVYECWRPHWVNPVTRGDRISAITWMQSYIAESWKRDLLNLLHSVAVKSSDQENFAKLGAVHEKLLKHWIR